VVLWLVIDPCVNFVDVCIVILGKSMLLPGMKSSHPARMD